MVTHIFQSQLTSKLNLRRQMLSLNVAQAFERGNPTASNIV